MVNKKVLLVGLGLATATTFAGCVNPLKPNVCLYGCPESFEHEENISEELDNGAEIKDDGVFVSKNSKDLIYKDKSVEKVIETILDELDWYFEE